MILDEKVTPGLICFGLQPLKEHLYFCRIQVVDGKPLVHCCLDGMGDSAQPTLELIFQTSEPGVKQGGVEHHLVGGRCVVH